MRGFLKSPYYLISRLFTMICQEILGGHDSSNTLDVSELVQFPKIQFRRIETIIWFPV